MVIDNIQEDLTTQNNVEVQEGKKFHEYIILILELLKFVKRAKMREKIQFAWLHDCLLP